jgi:hypothetical protein
MADRPRISFPMEAPGLLFGAVWLRVQPLRFAAGSAGDGPSGNSLDGYASKDPD